MDATVARDFDRIARLTRRTPALDRPSRGIVAKVPAGSRVLDVGCGLGALAAALAAKGCEVVAIDVSEAMVGRAQARGVDARVADLLTFAPPHPFDVVVSVNALHHVAFEEGLARMVAALAPDGRLFVVDLCATDGLVDLPRLVTAWAGVALDRVRGATPPALRRAWNEHGRHDVHLPFAEVTRRARRALPGCAVERLGAWRYALTYP